MRKMTSNSPVPIPNITFHLALRFWTRTSIQPVKIVVQNAQGCNGNRYIVFALRLSTLTSGGHLNLIGNPAEMPLET